MTRIVHDGTLVDLVGGHAGRRSVAAVTAIRIVDVTDEPTLPV